MRTKKLDVDTDRIKEDFGSVKRFLRLHGINENTYKVVISGHGTSRRIVDLLKKHGYLRKGA